MKVLLTLATLLTIATPAMANDVSIRTNKGTMVTAFSGNVNCKELPWVATQYVCSLYGVETDLTGKRVHFFQSEVHCAQDWGDGIERLDDYNSVACAAGRELGKTPIH